MSTEEYRKVDDTIEIEEVGDAEVKNTNQIRMYKSHPNGITFQLRTYKPIIPRYKNPEAKPRNMIASVSLSLLDIETIYHEAIRMFKS